MTRLLWGREAQSNVPDAALHAAKTKKIVRSFRAPLESMERLKLGSCSCATMVSVECDLGRDLCLVSRYCLNQSAAPVDHHTTPEAFPYR